MRLRWGIKRLKPHLESSYFLRVSFSNQKAVSWCLPPSYPPTPKNSQQSSNPRRGSSKIPKNWRGCAHSTRDSLFRESNTHRPTEQAENSEGAPFAYSCPSTDTHTHPQTQTVQYRVSCLQLSNCPHPRQSSRGKSCGETTQAVVGAISSTLIQSEVGGGSGCPRCLLGVVVLTPAISLLSWNPSQYNHY